MNLTETLLFTMQAIVLALAMSVMTTKALELVLTLTTAMMTVP